MKKTLLFLLAGSMAVSCTDPAVSEDEHGCIVLNLEEAMKRPSELKWSDLFSSIEYVPLETTDSCHSLIRSKILDMTDKYILVSDFDNKTPALFDRQGKFICRIGNPKDLPFVEDGDIDPKTNTITLFVDSRYPCTARFDMQGNLLERDSLPVQLMQSDKAYAHSPYRPSFLHKGNSDKMFCFDIHKDSVRVFLSDTYAMGKTLKRIPGTYGVFASVSEKAYFCLPCYNEEEEYLGYYDNRKDTSNYYRFYYDGRVENPYKVVYGNNNVDGCSFFYDMKKHASISVSLNKKDELFWYDAVSRRLHYVPEKIRNDLDGNFELALSEITPDGKMLYGLFPVVILQKIIASTPNTKLAALLDSLPENANGVLIYATLK